MKNKKFQIRNSKFEIRNYQRGMTIVEMAVGIGLTVILGGALVSIGILAIRASTSARMKAMATRYAEEAVEIVKRKRDEISPTDLASLFAWCNVPDGGSSNACFVNKDNELVTVDTDDTGEGPADISPLTERTITLLDRSDPPEEKNKLKVEVRVIWREGNLEKSVVLETYLTSWSD